MKYSDVIFATRKAIKIINEDSLDEIKKCWLAWLMSYARVSDAKLSPLMRLQNIMFESGVAPLVC